MIITEKIFGNYAVLQFDRDLTVSEMITEMQFAGYTPATESDLQAFTGQYSSSNPIIAIDSSVTRIDGHTGKKCIYGGELKDYWYTNALFEDNEYLAIK